MLMSSQDVCYRKGSGWNFHNLEVFFSYSQQLEEKYITPCLKLARRAIFLPPSKVYIRSFSVTITLIKFLLQKTVSDSLSLVLELNLLWRQRISQNIVNVHLSTSSISLGSEQMLSSLNTSMVFSSIQFSSVQSLSRVRHLATPWTTACQASCPLPTPGVYSNSSPLSWWCHPTILSSVVPFSSSLQSFPKSGSFQISQLFASGGQSTGVSALASFLPKKSQGWSLSEWTGWISLQSKGLSRVFSKGGPK